MGRRRGAGKGLEGLAQLLLELQARGGIAGGFGVGDIRGDNLLVALAHIQGLFQQADGLIEKFQLRHDLDSFTAQSGGRIIPLPGCLCKQRARSGLTPLGSFPLFGQIGK